MPTTVGNVAVYVTDLERSVAFYEEVVGLEVVARIETGEVRERLLASPAGGSQLMLAQEKPPRPVEHGTSLWKIFLDTDDVHALYHRTVAAGCEPVMPPTRLEQFPVTVAMVTDRDGYLLELGQRH